MAPHIWHVNPLRSRTKALTSFEISLAKAGSASWISAVLGNLVPAYMEVAPKIKLEKIQKRRKPFIPRDKTFNALQNRQVSALQK